MANWLDGLNEAQREAAQHNEGPLLILAGAGSGKTTVLVARAGRLLDEGIVAPEKLCVLTFTNKAARELKARVAKKIGPRAKKIWAGTFHSFGLHLLRKYHRKAKLPKEFGVMDGTDGNGIVKELLRNFHNQDKSAYDPERVLALLSDWRSAGKTEGNSKDDEYEQAASWVLPKYLKRLEHLGMVDFDGLILRPLDLIAQDEEVRAALAENFEYIMVDEFQDTNSAQMQLVRALAEPRKNLAVVGDDDQAIYGWRGACVSNILDFPKLYDPCQVVRLETNYRSTPQILGLANAVIAKNTRRHAKMLRPASESLSGPVPEIFSFETENEEAETVAADLSHLVQQGRAKRDLAVLYRSNSQGALMEAELRRLQLPYAMSGGTAFFDRKEIRDVLAYLRCGFRPNEVSFRRILNTPSRGIGEKTIEDLAAFAAQERLSFPEAALRWRETAVDERAGKSLEDLFGILQGLVPRLTEPDTKSSGARLLEWLVALGYRAYLDRHAPDKLIAEKRWRFLELFAGILDKFMAAGGGTTAALKEFLDAMELRDIPEDSEKEQEKIQLMTLHACKGLEFPVVFLLGLEEDILPHKTLGSDISEERRLFYVGITRAKERLVLTRALKRKRHGKWISSAPSRFLLDIPEALVVQHKGGRPMQTETRKSMLADLFKKLDTLDQGMPKL